MNCQLSLMVICTMALLTAINGQIEIIIEMEGLDPELTTWESGTTFGEWKQKLQQDNIITRKPSDYQFIFPNGEDNYSDDEIVDEIFTGVDRIDVKLQYNIIAVEKLKKEYKINDVQGCIQAVHNMNVPIIKLCITVYHSFNHFKNNLAIQWMKLINDGLKCSIEFEKNILLESLTHNQIKWLIDIKDEYGTALTRAIYLDDAPCRVHVVQTLLNNGANVDLFCTIHFWHATALMIAVGKDNKNIVKMLLDAGATVDLQNKDMESALIIAARKGYQNIVKILLDAGADIHLQKYYRTALSIAAKEGHEKIVEMLLAAGANTDLQDGSGHQTPLMEAAENGHQTIVEMLLAASANADLQTQYGTSALIIATINGYQNIVEILLASGAKVDLQNEDKESALIKATQYDYENIVKILLAASADIDLQSKYGTALSIAVGRGYQNIVEMLLVAGANTDLQDKNGWDTGYTPLMKAVREGDQAIVELLLAAGANVDLKDKLGRTALVIAEEENAPQSITELLTKKSKLSSARRLLTKHKA